MAVHLVKCSICQESFDTEKEEFVKTNSRRYAHKRCFEEAEGKKLKEENQILERRIENITTLNYLSQK